MSMDWTCNLCNEQVDDVEDHFRLFHCDVDYTPDHWPDGTAVFIEDMVTTDDDINTSTSHQDRDNDAAP